MPRSETRNKTDAKLPKCGKHARSTGKPCKHVAGKGTDHFGVGPCFMHGGDTPVIHGRWTVMRREALKERMASLQAEESDYLDLEQDLLLMRTIVLDYIERYDEVTEALIDWHRSYDEIWTKTSPALVRALKSKDPKVIEKAAIKLQAAWEYTRQRKPVKVKDLAEAVMLLEKCTKVVERVHKIRMVKALSLPEFERVLVQMGEVVSDFVRDETVTERIRMRWGKIRVKRVPKELTGIDMN